MEIKLKRLILIILDGFGIGYTDDAHIVRPEDVGANTCKHILEKVHGLKLENLEKMGLMNALGEEIGLMRKNPGALYGQSNLAHFGADTFYGHQEMMGTKPKMPVSQPFSMAIDRVRDALIGAGFSVEYYGDKLKFLFVNGCVTVADNIEADLGSVYNITSTLDLIDYKDVVRIGRIVRGAVSVSRVIAFGGRDVPVGNILSAVEEKDGRFIGINAPKSGVYDKGYNVIHLGYGVDPKVQVPTILGRSGINVTLIGKVADIVENECGKSISVVDTDETMKFAVREVSSMKSGFIAVNVQETDLAGHSQDPYKYAEKLKTADKYIGEIMSMIEGEDILIVTADHGNDPTIGHSHHTREKVPVLIYGEDIESGYIGLRETLSDMGATAAQYFDCAGYESGTSFLGSIRSVDWNRK